MAKDSTTIFAALGTFAEKIFLTMLISTAIGAAAAIGSAAYSAIKSSQANRNAQRKLQEEKDQNQRWYDFRSNQDFTSRTDAQAIINQQRELLQEQYRQQRATNAVAGGSEESVAAQKEAANAAMSNTMQGIAADASTYKEGVEDKYQARKAQIAQQEIQREDEKAQQIAQAGAQAINAGLGLMASGAGPQIKSRPYASADATILNDGQYEQNQLDETLRSQFLSQKPAEIKSVEELPRTRKKTV